ncbi:phage tail tape measure protein, lambda family [Pseudomonas mohnii]|uniref:Phage tail tape measure protein, lambda family n=1 Tax=Pseudomonas mohnii TaxID=395600 RepID=A0ABY0XRP3_9PSED|nr:phage tail tape measure protein [Pseudomonas mohnii]SEB99628.1 phage tail tape measure protein, lambda family [Pseudomonas mohnii]
MTSIAELGIRVDSSDAAQAADDLDKMTEAGKRSEDSVKRTGRAWEQAIGGMATNTQQIAKELQTLNAKQDATAKLMADIGRSISAASSSFQSAAASMGSYRAQSEAVSAAQDKIAQSSEKTGKAAAGIAAGFDKAAAAANGLSSAEGKLSESADAALARLTAMAKSSLDASEYYQRVTASISSNTSALEAAKSSGTDYAAMQKRFKAESDALAVATDRSTASSQKASAATEAQARDLAELLGKIDPTVAALKKLDTAQDQLSKFNAAGILPDGEFAKYTAKLDQARQRLGTFDDSLQKTGVSSAQTTAALRQLPAQFTDIFTSLQGGQAPMTVLIQQGGQLKDMFGGIGPAAKAMGGYVAGLINPFTLAAAAAVGLGVAYYKGSQEADAYSKSLILTGNSAGMTAGQLGDMARQVSATVGSTGAAAEVLASLASGGKIASDSYLDVAKAAVSMQEATGKAVSETVAEFNKLAGDPVKASAALNEQYNYLTASVYSQIVALEEQGNHAGAVKLATEQYADAINDRTPKILENLSLWEKGYNAVARAADSLKNVGRAPTNSERIQTAKDTLSRLETRGGSEMIPGEDLVYIGEKGKQSLRDYIRGLEVKDAAEADYATKQKERAAVELAGQKAIDALDARKKATRSNSDKRKDEIDSLNKEIADLRKSDPNNARLTQASIDQQREAINAKYKDAKTTAGSVDLSGFNDAQNKLKLITSEYDNAQQKLNAAQKSGLLSQKDYSEQSAALVEQEKGKITAAYQAEIDALEAAKGKKSTSAEQRIALDQKIADARTNMVKAQQDADTQLNVLSTNEEGRLKKQAAAVQTYIDALDDQLATTKKQLALSVAGVGMGDEARKRLQEDIKIQQEYQDKLDKLLAQKNKNQIDDSVYQQETAAVREALAQRLAMQKEYYGAVEAEQTNWLNGASSAYATYLEQVKDVAGQTKSAFTSAFKSLEDVLVSFATTGKASIKDFADSIIADFARIAIKSKVMPSVLGMFGVSSSSTAGASSAGSSGSGGSMDFESMLSAGRGIYSTATSGFGSTVAAGWNAGEGFLGGMKGALSNGSSYVNSGLSSLFGSSGGAASSAAQGATQAGYTGSQMANWSAAQTGSTWGGAAASFGAAAGGIGGAIQGYQNSGVKGAVAGGLGGWGGATAGTIAGTAAASALSGTAMGAAMGSVLPGIGTVIGAALGAAFGSKLFAGEWTTKDQGIQVGVEGGDLNASQYEYQKKKGGLFGKNKKRTRLSVLDPEMQAALDNTYDATENSVLTLFDRLNVKLNDGVLDGLNVASTQISTKDKTAEQIQEEIAKWFGGVADSMVTAVDSAVGAGLGGRTFEGLTTFVNNLYSVNDVLENLNVDLYDFSVSGGLLAERLSAMAGGLESLTKNAGTYYENFFSDTEKADDTLAAVGKQFAALGLALPDTRDAYRAVIEALDMTTTAGQQMFVTMTGLAGNASQAYTILEQRATQAAQAIADALMGAVTGSNGALQRAIAAEQKNVTAAYNARVTSLNDMASTASKNVSDLTGVSNSLGSALKQLRGDSDETVKALRNQAQATLQSALSKARAGGSLAEFAGLSDALDTLGSNNTDLYRSMEDFQRDQGRTVNEVAELNKLNGKQLTTAEQTVEYLQDQLDLAEDDYKLQMAKFDDQLAFAQAQMDALNGIDNSVKSVADAISAMNMAVIAALAGMGGKGTTNSATTNGAYIDTIYTELLGRDADKAGRDYWLGQVSKGDITLDQLAQAIANAAKENKEKVKAGYATGGLISGPGTGTSDSIIARLSNGEYVLTADAVRTYGTDLLDQMNGRKLPAFAGGGIAGPGAKSATPTRVYSVTQTAATPSGSGDSAATIAELRQLRADIHNDLAFLTKHMEKTAYNTTQINESGVQVVNTVKTEAA